MQKTTPQTASPPLLNMEGLRAFDTPLPTRLFPPYSPQTVAQRFPGDTDLHQRTLALDAWLNRHMEVADIAQETGVSQASLYRWRKSWQSHGIAALSSSARNTPVAPDLAQLRTLFYILRISTPFALGVDPIARHLAPQYSDPAERGYSIAQALHKAVEHVDAEIAARVGVPDLLTRHFIQGMTVGELSEQGGYSPASLYRLFADGLARVAALLPQLITRPVDMSVGAVNDRVVYAVENSLCDGGHTALVGGERDGCDMYGRAVRGRWVCAGWSAFWLTYDPQHPQPVSSCLESLYRQAAAIGVLRTVHPNPRYTPERQLSYLLTRLAGMPTLLIVANADGGYHNGLWQTLLTTLGAPRPAVRVLLLGHNLPHPAYSPIYLTTTPTKSVYLVQE